MKLRFIATTAGALLATIALAATSLASGASEGNGADRLFGGGRFQVDFDLGPGELALPRDISVQATGFNARGGSGTRHYGDPNRAEPAPAVGVSCLNVEGNRAVIGALAAGTLGVQYFEDNGSPGPDIADRISPVLILTTAENLALMPQNFPQTCPSATPPAEFGEPRVNLESGDIAVVDGAG